MNEIKKALNESPAARWGILLLASFTMAANYYFYDALSPLQQLLQEKLQFSATNYGFLVSTYSIPNTFLCMAVIGGIILDRLGIRRTGFSFVAMMTIGALLTAYGASDAFHVQHGIGYNFFNSFLTDYSPELKMMSLGFFLFGLGAETSIVVINKIIVKWFNGKDIAFAFAVNLAIARIGTAMALIVSPKLVSETQWNKPIWFAAFFMCLGFLVFLVYLMYDVKLDRQKQIKVSLDETEVFKFSDIGNLLKNPSFVFITLLCVTFYSAVFPFLKYAPNMMQNKFGFSADMAGTIASILPFGTVIFTPIFGWLTDNKGYSASVMILGSALLILVHLTFTFTNITPYVPMFVLGIAFSLVPAAMWPSVAKIVDTNKLGTAYGLMFSIQNLGLWAFPILIGLVLDKTNSHITPEMLEKGTATYDYTYAILMLVVLGCLGLLFAFLLRKADKTSGYGLDLPNKTK